MLQDRNFLKLNLELLRNHWLQSQESFNHLIMLKDKSLKILKGQIVKTRPSGHLMVQVHIIILQTTITLLIPDPKLHRILTLDHL